MEQFTTSDCSRPWCNKSPDQKLKGSSCFKGTRLVTTSALSRSQVLVNSNLGCKVSGFRPLQEDKIEAVYTTLVRVIEQYDFISMNLEDSI